MGDDEFVDLLSTARGRPADLAAQQLVALPGRRARHPRRAGADRAAGLAAALGVPGPRPRQGRRRHPLHRPGRLLSWALEAGDRAAIELLREFSEAVEPPILERRGEVVKRLGDGVMAAFWDAPSAAEAAFAAAERTARSRSTATGRSCAPASTSAARARSAATTSASTSTSPPASPRPPSPARSSSPTASWSALDPGAVDAPGSAASAPRARRRTWPRRIRPVKPKLCQRRRRRRDQRDRHREAGGAAQGGDAAAGLDGGADLADALAEPGDGRIEVGGDEGEAPEEGGPVAAGALGRLGGLLHDLEDGRRRGGRRPGAARRPASAPRGCGAGRARRPAAPRPCDRARA